MIVIISVEFVVERLASVYSSEAISWQLQI